jgi:hypothetical protein
MLGMGSSAISAYKGVSYKYRQQLQMDTRLRGYDKLTTAAEEKLGFIHICSS